MNYIYKLAQMLSLSLNLQVSFSLERGEACRADVKKRIIYLPKENELMFYSEQYLLHNLIHEVGHLLFTKVDKQKLDELVEPYKNIGEQIMLLLNALEDMRIEEKLDQKFNGYRYIKKQSLMSMRGQLIMEQMSQLIPLHIKALKHIANFVFRLDLPLPTDSYQNIEKVNLLINEVKKHYGDIVDSTSLTGIIDVLLQTDNNDILKLYIDLLPKKRRCQNKPQEQEAMQMLQRIKSDIAKEENTLNSFKGKIEDELDGLQENVKDIIDEVSIVGKDSFEKEKEVTLQDASSYLGKITKSLSLIKEKSFKREENNHKRGKIKGSHLYKVSSGNRHVFTQKQLPKEDTNVAFGLVLDVSGSMNTTRRDVATTVIDLLAQSLTKAEKEFCVVAFDNKALVVKPVTQAYSRQRLITIASSMNGGTNLNQGLMKTIPEMNKANAPRKVVFIITDGDTDDKNEVKETVQKTKKDIEYIAILLDTSCQDTGIDRNIHIASIDELPNVFNSVLCEIAGRK